MGDGGSRLVGGAAIEEAVATVRAKWILVVALVLLGLLAGIVFGASKDTRPLLEMRVKVNPLGSNTTAVALGVSAPRGPVAADFVSETVLASLEHTTGLSKQKLEEEIGVKGIANTSEELIMVVGGDGDESQALMRHWYLAVQRDQRAIVANAIAQTRQGYVEELNEIEPLVAREQAVENIARLSGLSGSLRSTVAILRAPEVKPSSAHSTVFYGIAGLLGGIVIGLAVALGVGLLERKLRTPAALSAQFGLPIVADVRAGGDADEAGFRERLKLAAGDGPEPPEVVVVAAGPEGSAKAAADALQRVSAPVAVGAVGSAEAQASLGTGAPWVLAVTPGETRSDQAADLRAELPGLPRRPLGLVLV
jgi:hypothetical protein